MLLVLLSVYSDRVMFLTVSHEIDLGCSLCLQCNPMSDVVSCGLMGDVAPCSFEGVLVVLLSVYFDRDVFSIVSNEVNLGFRLCLQCNHMGDVVPCSLMGDVVP